MSDIKCPFCHQELKELYCNGICVGLACKNVDCLETKSTLGNKALWQALIQAKQDLVITKSTLEYLGYEFAPAFPEKTVIEQMRQKARNAVKCIEHGDK